MNKLTKAQVIALFLGSSQAAFDAAAITAVLNGPSVCPSTKQCTDSSASNYQALQGTSAGTTGCTNNNACSSVTSTQRCALVSELQSSTVYESNMCVHNSWCGFNPAVTTNTFRQTASSYFEYAQLWATGASVPTATGTSVTNIQLGAFGKRSSNNFQVQCFVGTTETTAPTTPTSTVITNNFTAVKQIIDSNSSGSYTWDGYTDMFVSPASNFQDGWWYKSSTNWIENDKPAIQHCGFSDQCATNECCVQWPDTNNRRCKPSNYATPSRQNHFLMGGVYVSRAQCEPANWAAFLASLSVTVTDASTTVDQQALDDAKRDVQDFLGSLYQDAATRAGYFTTGTGAWSTLAKNTWDTNYNTTVTVPNTTLHAQLVTNAAISGLTLSQQTGFYQELLEWEKTKYNACQTNSLQITCIQADEIKKQEETARAAATVNGTAKNYYTMTATEKAAFTSARASTVQALESSLASAWLTSNQPTNGAAGAACTGSTGCNSGLCCGTATPNTGQYVNPTVQNVCGTTPGTYTDGLGVAHTMTCNQATGAEKLMWTAAAAAVAALSLM